MARQTISRRTAGAPILTPVPHVQMDAARQPIADALTRLTERRIATLEELRTCVDLLELAPYRDVAAAVEPARIAVELAAELGDEQLQIQVQLIHIDILGRQGNAAESGHLLFGISEWARTEGNPHVRARCHYLMSKFYRYLGDPSTSLEHALHSLEVGPDDMLPELRAEHMLSTALAVELSGHSGDAAHRYGDVVELGLRIGHPLLSINALNNWACVACETNRPEEGLVLVARMQAGQRLPRDRFANA